MKIKAPKRKPVFGGPKYPADPYYNDYGDYYSDEVPQEEEEEINRKYEMVLGKRYQYITR